MNNPQDRFEWFKNAYRQYAGDIADVTDWQYLQSAAIYRKHTGDLDGAIEAMVKAITLMRKVTTLSEETATNLNYLADLYLTKNATEQAYEALREAIELSRPHFPGLLAANLRGLAEIQRQKGEYREALASAEEARQLDQQLGDSYGVTRAEELIKEIKPHLSEEPPNRSLQRESAPIFLGGAGRSGTTLLRVLLDSHPRICCGPELKVLPSIAEWYQTLTRSFAPVMQSYGNTPADLQLRFRQFIEGLVENFRRASGKPRWAEKTPHNVLFMVPLGEIFPDARFLHVIRDGRDVACSLITMDWINPLTGQKWDYVQSIGNAARYWREVVTLARQQTRHPSLAGRVLEVRYETLVANPEKIMRQVLQFLDVPWDDAVLAHHKKDRSREPIEASTRQAARPISGGSLGRWKEEMALSDKAAFKAEAGALLKELGYAPGDW